MSSAVVPMVIAMSVPGCGGKSSDFDFGSGGTSSMGTGGSAPGSGSASSSGGSSISSGGWSSGSGGNANGAGGSQARSICNQPIVSGYCDAYMPRYAFEPDTGQCVPFVYGGCDGNDNRFDTLAECDAECRGGDPTPIDTCESSADCRLIENVCCGVCEPALLEQFAAVNQSFAYPSPFDPCGGADVLCGACEAGESVSQNFVAVCETGKCVAKDLREEDELSGCTSDDDCRLRAGAECCTGCSEDDWVALSMDEASFIDAFCPAEFGCPDCVPPDPSGVHAACVAGSCALVAD